MSDGVSSVQSPAPNGATQALTTGAAALLVPTAAFLWWWVFGFDAAWTSEATGVLLLGAIGVASLATVPVLAASVSRSLRSAKWAYTLGACFAIGAIGLGMAQSLSAAGPEDESAGPTNLTCAREAKVWVTVPTRHRNLTHRA
jgi:hypothetical protein